MKLNKCSFYDKFVNHLKKGKSFTFTGLTSFSRILLAKHIQELSGKKILFITSTEQAGLKYCADLERIFEVKSELLPYATISPYETLPPNFYDYQKQISVLLNKPDFIITPAKTLTEKFPMNNFFEEN